jgi:hypothetical protein
VPRRDRPAWDDHAPFLGLAFIYSSPLWAIPLLRWLGLLPDP